MNWQLLIDEFQNTPGAQKDAYGIEETTEHWHGRLLLMKWRHRIERVACRRKGIDYSSCLSSPGTVREAYNEYMSQLSASEGKSINEILFGLEEGAQQRDKEQMLEKLNKYYPDAKQVLKNGD
jgi:hypothetical protein